MHWIWVRQISLKQYVWLLSRATLIAWHVDIGPTWFMFWHWDITHFELFFNHQINGLAQNCSNTMAKVLELLQSCTKPSTGFIAVREMSGRNKISQGQGIVGILQSVREILTFGKIDEKCHGILDNVRQNDHFGQHDSPVSTYIDQLAKSRLRNFIK